MTIFREHGISDIRLRRIVCGFILFQQREEEIYVI
jgi:hypothetical protein